MERREQSPYLADSYPTLHDKLYTLLEFYAPLYYLTNLIDIGHCQQHYHTQYGYPH